MTRVETEPDLDTTGLFLSVAYTVLLTEAAIELQDQGENYHIEILGDKRGDGREITEENIWAVKVTGNNIPALLQKTSELIGGRCLMGKTREYYWEYFNSSFS